MILTRLAVVFCGMYKCHITVIIRSAVFGWVFLGQVLI